MPAWLWITPLAAVAFVFWIGWGRGWLRSWRYDWQRAQHVRARAREEVEAASVFYGSMSLSDEQVLHHELPWWPAPPVDPEPWGKRLPDRDTREQMMAELSPEALAVCPCGKPIDHTEFCYGSEIVLPDAGGWISGPCLDDPGPGDAAVEPPASSGPDQVPLRERLRGPVQPHEKPAGTESAGTGHPYPLLAEDWATRKRLQDLALPAPAPSRWLAEQLDILRAWSERQQVYAEVLA